MHLVYKGQERKSGQGNSPKLGIDGHGRGSGCWVIKSPKRLEGRDDNR